MDSQPLFALCSIPLLLPSASVALVSTPTETRPLEQPGETGYGEAPRLSEREVAAFVHSQDLDQEIHHDIGEDGALWVRGASWKMSFDERVATYFPLLGPRQLRHYPHRLSPLGLSVGERYLAFDRVARPELVGDRVEIDRHTFVETYELAPDSVEQLFVFPEVPQGGDLSIWIDTGSELDASELADDLEFRSEAGRMTYSRAVAIDARGERETVLTELVGNTLRIRVDADFLAHAVAPLVIDPVIRTFPVDTSGAKDLAPDVAFDFTYQLWLIVWERWNTNTERDVAFRLMTDLGATAYTGFVNLDNADWTRPKCANNNAYDSFFVVATYHGLAGWQAYGRSVNAYNAEVGPVRALSDVGGNDVNWNPSVGGDSSNNAFSTFCVVYERNKPSGDHDINYRMVTGNGNVVGQYSTPLSPSVTSIDVMPGISKSNDGQQWMIAFDRETSGNDDVLAARIRSDGTITGFPIFVMSSSSDDFGPRVSSPLNGTQRYLITTASLGDVLLVAMDGYTKLAEGNLSSMELGGGGSPVVQNAPCVDSDGARFFVAYSETNGGSQNVLGSALRLNGSSLSLVETRVPIASTPTIEEFQPSIASMESAGGMTRRFCIPWTAKSPFWGTYNVLAAIYDRP